MRKEPSIKYPSSVNLFNFCRKVLDHKYGGIRVIDQDIGSILNFEPADCSHWKKGKKNIKSFNAIKSIANHLGVDEKLVIDVASGELDENEAFYEFNEYNQLKVDPNTIELAKKHFYRKNAGVWSKEKELDFKNFFEIDTQRINNIVSNIHNAINFAETPLYLPEVANAFPDIALIADDSLDWNENNSPPIKVIKKDDKTEIYFKKGTDSKPYMRFCLAKSIAQHFLTSHRNIDELNDYRAHIENVEKCVFAAKLLTPANLIRKEMANINISRDIITQLAESFWVAKTFMNMRLKEILENEELI